MRGTVQILPVLQGRVKIANQSSREIILIVDTGETNHIRETSFCHLKTNKGNVVVGLSSGDDRYMPKVGIWQWIVGRIGALSSWLVDVVFRIPNFQCFPVLTSILYVCSIIAYSPCPLDLIEPQPTWLYATINSSWISNMIMEAGLKSGLSDSRIASLSGLPWAILNPPWVVALASFLHGKAPGKDACHLLGVQNRVSVQIYPAIPHPLRIVKGKKR